MLRRFMTVAVTMLALSFAAYGQAGAAAAKAKSKVSSEASSAKAKATTQAKAAAGDAVDINTASASELDAIPGIGKAYSKKIIAGRPYANKSQLVSKGVLPQKVYDKVADRIIAKQK